MKLKSLSLIYQQNLDVLTTEFGCFKSAPSYICEGLNLKKDTYWIMCLAEILDLHKPPKFGKTKSVEVFDLLLEKGLVIG